MNNLDFISISKLNLTPSNAILELGDTWANPVEISVDFELELSQDSEGFLPDQARLLIVHAQSNDVYGIIPAQLVDGTTHHFQSSIRLNNPSDLRIYGINVGSSSTTEEAFITVDPNLGSFQATAPNRIPTEIDQAAINAAITQSTPLTITLNPPEMEGDFSVIFPINLFNDPEILRSEYLTLQNEAVGGSFYLSRNHGDDPLTYRLYGSETQSPLSGTYVISRVNTYDSFGQSLEISDDELGDLKSLKFSVINEYQPGVLETQLSDREIKIKFTEPIKIQPGAQLEIQADYPYGYPPSRNVSLAETVDANSYVDQITINLPNLGEGRDYTFTLHNFQAVDTDNNAISTSLYLTETLDKALSSLPTTAHEQVLTSVTQGHQQLIKVVPLTDSTALVAYASNSYSPEDNILEVVEWGEFGELVNRKTVTHEFAFSSGWSIEAAKTSDGGFALYDDDQISIYDNSGSWVQDIAIPKVEGYVGNYMGGTQLSLDYSTRDNGESLISMQDRLVVIKEVDVTSWYEPTPNRQWLTLAHTVEKDPNTQLYRLATNSPLLLQQTADFVLQGDAVALGGNKFLYTKSSYKPENSSQNTVSLQVYDQDLNPIGSPYALDSYYSQAGVQYLPQTMQVYAWNTILVGEYPDLLNLGRILNVSDGGLTPAMPLNGENNDGAFALGNPYQWSNRFLPTLTPDGRYFLVEDEQSLDDVGIALRRFDPYTYTVQDNAFNISEYTTSTQHRPIYELLPDGRIFMAWQSGYQDGSQNAITFRVFTADELDALTSRLSIMGSDADDLITGTEANEFILGLNGNDRLIGGGGNDEIDGGGGDDILEGGEGLDRLIGGLGNDRFLVRSSQTIIVETSEADLNQEMASIGRNNDHLVSFVDFTLAEGVAVESMHAAGSLTGELFESVISLTGNASNQALFGNEASNTLLGMAGNDVLIGFGGEDILDGGDGDDLFVSGAGDDQLIGGAGEDRFLMGLGKVPVENGFLGRMTLVELTGGYDRADGGDGVDTLIANGSEFDYEVGFLSPQTYVLYKGGVGGEAMEITNIELISFGDVNIDSDEFQLNPTVVNFSELSNVNIIHGTSGNDNLVGTSRSDELRGMEGNDTLNGGLGNDRYIGGTGTDTAIIEATDGLRGVSFTERGWTFRTSAGTDFIAADVERLRLGTGTTQDASLHLLSEDSPSGSLNTFLGTGSQAVGILGGDVDVALGLDNDSIGLVNAGQTNIISGGGGSDRLYLAGSQSDWDFGVLKVDAIQDILRSKYAGANGVGQGGSTDPFSWNNSALDVILVATSRDLSTTVYFQTEEVTFTNDTQNFRDSESLLPSFNYSADATVAQLTQANFYGRRGTNDTLNLKVSNVEESIKYIGSWLDTAANPTASSLTGSPLADSTSVVLRGQAGTGPAWFSGTNTIANAGYNLVDIENIRLSDLSGHTTTIRVAGGSGYRSVSEAVATAQRGDVIFVAENKEVINPSTNKLSLLANDSNITVDAGLRVFFEELRTSVLPSGIVHSIQLSEQTKFAPATPTSNAVNLQAPSVSANPAIDPVNLYHSDLRVLQVLGTAAVNVTGSSLDDVIIGNRGSNQLIGGLGNDLIYGGFGSDSLLGGGGNDILIGGSPTRMEGIRHTPEEGVLNYINVDSDTLHIANTDVDFATGDKLSYNFGGGSSATAILSGSSGTALTNSTTLYAIRIDESSIKLATSLDNANKGISINLTQLGSATSQGFTLDNITYTSNNLPGADMLNGGSGDDLLIATGVMGSLSSANTRDLLTLNGGSGNDTFAILGNSGAISMVGGSGRDTVILSESFNDIVGVNKSARFTDFDATSDSVISTFSGSDLLGKTIERQLGDDGLVLNQLISPPGLISESINYSRSDDSVLIEAQPFFSSNGDDYATTALVTAVQQAALASG